MTAPIGSEANPVVDRNPVNDVQSRMIETLRDDYQLQPAEAEQAVQSYLGSRTEPLLDSPDQASLLAAADGAYSLWASVTDPAIVAVRELAQRVTTIESDIAYAENYLDIEEQAGSLALSQAYLELGVARDRLEEANVKLDEARTTRQAANTLSLSAANQYEADTWKYALGPDALVVSGVAYDSNIWESDGEGGVQRRHTEYDTTDGMDDPNARPAVTDLEAASYDALADVAVNAPATFGVPDAAPTWDRVGTPAPHGELEQDLQPDRVRYWPAQGQDTVVLEAGFGSATVTVHQTGFAHQPGQYTFSTIGPDGRSPIRELDAIGMGVIAAGDREPHPDRADIYAELGAQVREHLTVLADTVVSQREALQSREHGRLAALQATTAPTMHVERQRSL